MGFRFRRTFRLFPGVRLNISKGGVSASVGPHGATLNLGKRGLRGTVGLPGTGMSYSTQLGSFASARANNPYVEGVQRPFKVVWLLPLGVLIVMMVGMCSTRNLSTAAPVTGVPKAAPISLRIVVATKLNCRATASEAAPVVRTLQQNQLVEVGATAGAWIKITDVKPSCWASTDYLDADIGKRAAL